MSANDPRAEMTLELSRRAQEPSAADRLRNLAALRERLGLPLPPASSRGNEPGFVREPAATQPARAPAVAAGGSRATFAQLAAVGVVTGALGFFLGTRAAPTPSPVERAAPAALDSAPAPLAPHAVPATRTAHETNDDTRSATEAAAPASAAPSAGRRATKARQPAARTPPASASSATPSVTDDAHFLDAVRLLRRARSALSKGEAALALALLDELDQRFPRELLDEERGATRVLALCANGDESAASALARALLSAHPRSIYTPRLEQSCAAEAAAPTSPE
jgi:hypothetical protein